jgi:MFS transporter, PPP family, 3-phenylpropionic acid transporter
VVQMMHGLTYGITQVGTMGLLLRHVPSQVTATAQGYLTAGIGIAMSSAAMLSGVIYAHHGRSVYYPMAAMAVIGALVMWLARRKAEAPYGFTVQPQSAASGG